MGQTGSQLAAVVSFRVGGKLSTAQILPYLQSGLALIEAAGSYSWDMFAGTQAIPANGNLPIPAAVDVGREIAFVNPNGLPIVKATAGQDQSYSMNFKNTGTGIYNHWVIVGQNFSFRPAQNPGLTVNYNWHILPPVLLVAGGPSTPWAETWLDDLVIDYAESEIKRVLNWAGWQELGQRFVARLMDVKSIFSTQRENTALPGEVQQTLQEKTQIGRT
jgi:hypothetical protein